MTDWTAPISWPRGLFVSSPIMNQQIRDNERHLKEQLQALGANASADFSGLVVGTHPSDDLYQSQIYLTRATWIIVLDSDGNASAVEVSTPMTAAITTSGLNGLDTGTEEASTWYEIYMIRRPVDGALALLLHKKSDVYFLDEQQTTGGSSQAFRDTASGVQKVAQGFQIDDTDVPISHVVLSLQKQGSPTGYVWVTIESDNAGSPSGTAIATSMKFDVSTLQAATNFGHVLFKFDTVASNLLTGVQYHIVLNSDVTVSGANYLRALAVGSSTYPRGQVKTYNGTSWAGVTADLYFQVWVHRAAVAPTLPTGYTQKALLGYVYNNSGSNFTRFIAHDKLVTPMESQLIAASPTTLPVIVSMAALVPPIGLRIHAVMEVGSSGGYVRMGARGGYGISNVPRGANGQAIVYQGAAAGAMGLAGIVNTDIAEVYVSAGAPGGHLYLSSWEWF